MTEQVLSTSSARPVVVVGGGSGFIGHALGVRLAERFDVVGISRTKREPDAHFTEWRAGDFFNLREAENALKGARFAIYLVHSMLPSARLTQGSFRDLDLICADNFARAAKHAGVEQIIYLGGLVPETGDLSPHLASRLEVERTLGRYGVPVTTLRAGLVIGGGGSSFEILRRLVQRLPAMLVPKWTLTRMQPVAVADVIALLSFVVGRRECYGETYDVGAPEALDYRTLMAITAEILGLRRPMIPVPLFTPSLSRLWVSLVTGASKALVAPLVESLRHEMVARDLRLAAMAGLEPTPVRRALEHALATKDAPSAKAEEESAPLERARIAKKAPPSLVRSVQRMRLPGDRDAEWAAKEYMRWLPGALRGLVRVETDDNRDFRFVVFLVGLPLLVLTYAPDRSTPDRQLFFVTGGVLSRPAQRGRFELRQVLDGHTLMTAIHDFGPRLPWFVYVQSQARFHAWVMAAFRRHIATATARG
jgi:uncharacterized protein YbjT (DUF2867 family)